MREAAVHQAPGFAGLRISRFAAGLLAVVCVLALVAGCRADSEPSLGFPDDGADRSEGPGEHLPTTSADIAPRSAPAEGATSTVRRVFAVPVDGEEVVLSGRVVELTGRHTFILDDGTGAIAIHGNERCGPFDVGDEVVVTGTVDLNESPFHVEIEAVGASIR